MSLSLIWKNSIFIVCLFGCKYTCVVDCFTLFLVVVVEDSFLFC